MSRRVLLLLPVVVWTAVEATTYSIGTSYAGTDCSGTPYSVSAYAMEEGDECVEEVCADYNADPSEVTAEMVSYECSTSDYISAMREKFGASPYIIQVVYKDNGCVTLDEAFGYPAIGNCEGSFYNNESTYVIGKLDDNGSASLRFFDTAECLTDSQLASFSMTRKTLDSHSCDSDNYKWYTSKDGESSALSTGAIIGIKIMTGTARVEFSEMSLQSIVELGYACVAVEPSARPSAAEALYRLQLTLSQEL
ncbi:hypothetical protein KRP22_005137 [Phytophthora ramorum]|nr:hypothetical protein KRP22_12721 [Phytophthora ramorum]